MNRTNEEKLELFADLLEPVTDILSDPEVAQAWRTEKTVAAIRKTVKGHKREIIAVLALIEGISPDEYEINGLALLLKLIDLLNRPDVKQMVDGLFTLQDRIDAAAPSGPATENTGDGAK